MMPAYAKQLPIPLPSTCKHQLHSNHGHFRLVDHASFMPCQWPVHSLLKWINTSTQWIYNVHRVLHPSTPNSVVTTNDAQCETISCLSNLIFDRLAQSSTRTHIVRLHSPLIIVCIDYNLFRSVAWKPSLR
jgi:hypothetical protein